MLNPALLNPPEETLGDASVAEAPAGESRKPAYELSSKLVPSNNVPQAAPPVGTAAAFDDDGVYAVESLSREVTETECP